MGMLRGNSISVPPGIADEGSDQPSEPGGAGMCAINGRDSQDSLFNYFLLETTT